MASSDNGKQRMTFAYQQEGTAEGFNKLLLNIIPYGIIKGGNLVRVGDEQSNTVNIESGTEMMIGDGNVLLHVTLQETATVNVDSNHRYVVAYFVWSNTVNNYVTFEAKAYDEITDNMIILGKCEYIGQDLLNTFDYTRKTWQKSHYDNDFLFATNYHTYAPSFNVALKENASFTFEVNRGKCILQGKEISIDTTETVTLEIDDTDSKLYINRSVDYGRCDLLCLAYDDTVAKGYHFEYIQGEDIDVPNPQPRTFPKDKLVLAKINVPQGTITSDNYRGSNIENIYNNNYKSFCATVGDYENDSATGKSHLVNEHTLYL